MVASGEYNEDQCKEGEPCSHDEEHFFEAGHDDLPTMFFSDVGDVHAVFHGEAPFFK